MPEPIPTRRRGPRGRAAPRGVTLATAPVVAVLAVAAALLAACGAEPVQPEEPEVVVFAAASLRDVLQALDEPARRQAGLAPVYNFAGSNVLARQIVAAPAADVFLSADERWVNELEAAGRLLIGSRRALLANRLVAVARPDGPAGIATPADLAGDGYRFLSVGDPDAVPAGVYARRFLETARLAGDATLWSAVEDRVAPAPDVRAALAMVEARRDAVGLVYATDAATSDAVRVLFEVPPDLAPRIRYGAAAVAGGPGGGAVARAYLDFLASETARRVFEEYGFEVLGEDGGPAGPLTDDTASGETATGAGARAGSGQRGAS
jgi:molybdate transport system substrate-binding protein